jgi:hypothetical protein
MPPVLQATSAAEPPKQEGLIELDPFPACRPPECEMIFSPSASCDATRAPANLAARQTCSTPGHRRPSYAGCPWGVTDGRASHTANSPSPSATEGRRYA